MWTPFKWLWGHRDCETVSGYPRGGTLYRQRITKGFPSGLAGAAHTQKTHRALFSGHWKRRVTLHFEFWRLSLHLKLFFFFYICLFVLLVKCVRVMSWIESYPFNDTNTVTLGDKEIHDRFELLMKNSCSLITARHRLYRQEGTLAAWQTVCSVTWLRPKNEVMFD